MKFIDPKGIVLAFTLAAGVLDPSEAAAKQPACASVTHAFAQVGHASWYGPGFHGRLTANGERYDMNKMTAAHLNLPLASVVRVENLENGKQVTLRVNDRGPYHGDRILDVSKKAATLLGFLQDGIARVRIRLCND